MENKYAIRLKNLIDELDIKQNELAQKAGITEATISNFLNLSLVRRAEIFLE